MHNKQIDESIDYIRFSDTTAPTGIILQHERTDMLRVGISSLEKAVYYGNVGTQINKKLRLCISTLDKRNSTDSTK